MNTRKAHRSLRFGSVLVVGIATLGGALTIAHADVAPPRGVVVEEPAPKRKPVAVPDAPPATPPATPAAVPPTPSAADPVVAPAPPPPAPPPAAADAVRTTPAAGAGDNALAGVPMEKYALDRDRQGDDPVLAGRRFLTDLKAVAPRVHANVVDAVRSEIQAEEALRFARQNRFVLWAYGAAWAIVAVLAAMLLVRQRRLAAELAELEARVKVEK